jgi:hypothetical protein
MRLGRSSCDSGGVLHFVGEVGRPRSTPDRDGSQADARRRSVVEEASASTQDHGHEMQAEFVDRARLEVLARYIRASVDLHVGRPAASRA